MRALLLLVFALAPAACVDRPTSADAGVDGGGDVRPPAAPRGTVRLLAGATLTGFADGDGPDARFFGPAAIAPSADLAALFVADTFAGTVRRVDIATGAVVTIGGQPLDLAPRDGPREEALFSEPRGMAATTDGAHLWVGDGPCLRRIDTTTLAVETLIGDPFSEGLVDAVGRDARFGFLMHDVEADDDALYVADRVNDAIRRVDLGTLETTTLAGGLAGPGGLALDGADLYVADTFADRIVRVDVASGAVAVVSTDPLLVSPQGIALVEGTLYATGFDGAVVAIDPTTGAARITAGVVDDVRAADGPAGTARLGGAFSPPAPAGPGAIFYLDMEANSVRRVDVMEGSVTTVAGPADPLGHRDGDDARFRKLYDVDVGDDGVWVPDTENHVVRAVAADTAAVTTVAGAPGVAGNVDGPLTDARFRYPTGVAVDDATGRVYVVDSGNHAIRVLDDDTGAVTTLVGAIGVEGAADGDATTARFRDPWHVALDAARGVLYVADSGNAAVRVVDVATGAVTTLAGALGQEGHVDGVGGAARFRLPVGVALGPDDVLYVTDYAAHTVRAIDTATGDVTTVAGQDRTAGRGEGALDRITLSSPSGLDVDGDVLFVADTGNDRVVRLSLATAHGDTWFGLNGFAANIGGGPAVRLEDAPLLAPESVAVTPEGLAVVTEAAVLLTSSPAAALD